MNQTKNSLDGIRKFNKLTEKILKGYILAEDLLGNSIDRAEETFTIWVDSIRDFFQLNIQKSTFLIKFNHLVSQKKRDYLSDPRELLQNRIIQGIKTLKSVRYQILESDFTEREKNFFQSENIKHHIKYLIPLFRRDNFDKIIDEITFYNSVDDDTAKKILEFIRLRLEQGCYNSHDVNARIHASETLSEVSKRLTNFDIAKKYYNVATEYAIIDEINDSWEVCANSRNTVFLISEVWNDSIKIDSKLDDALNSELPYNLWLGRKSMILLENTIEEIKKKIDSEEEIIISNLQPDPLELSVRNTWEAIKEEIFEIGKKISLEADQMIILEEGVKSILQVLSSHLKYPKALKNLFDAIIQIGDSRSVKKEEQILHPWFIDKLSPDFIKFSSYEETIYSKNQISFSREYCQLMLSMTVNYHYLSTMNN